ncbi:phage portal protein [Methylocystis sp. L43]|jgi:HK97 family phage portal protein|nr:phage portal protein [Methylocystis sp. L43]MBG0804161.1 phage portal protein [Methylocystis sp. H15]
MPSLLSRLIGAVAPPRETKYSRAAKLLAMHALGQPHWSARNSTVLTREGYERNAVCHRCVRMVAEAAASVPWLIYEGREEAIDHPLISLIERPNPLDTSASFIEAICANLLLYGNAYVESVLIDEELRELYALRPDRMSIEAGRNGWPAAFIYRALGQEARYEMRGEGIEPILHIKFFNPLDDYYGFPPLAAAQVALDTHNAASFWNKALLDNSARPSGALVYAGPEGAHLTDEQFSRLKEELEENFSGATNAGRPLLLEGGLDWKALSLSPKDMDFTESKAGAAREIALAFGVPPLLLGLPGDNTFSNYAEANRAFWRQTVLPLVARVQKSFHAWLRPGFGSFRLDYNADRLEALASERAAEWERVGKAAFLTLDEQREALGYGPAPKEALVAKRDVGLERRYSPEQPRVPAGNSGGGQWTSGGGGGDSGGGFSGARDVGGRVQTAQNTNPNVASDADNPLTRVQSRRVAGGENVAFNRDHELNRGIESQVHQVQNRRYDVELAEEEHGPHDGHTIRDHVGKSDENLKERSARTRTRVGPLGFWKRRIGTFPSVIAANKLVNSTLSQSPALIEEVASGRVSAATLEAWFLTPTGKEAYAPKFNSNAIIRDTFGVRVLIAHVAGSKRGFKVFTAFPINDD